MPVPNRPTTRYPLRTELIPTIHVLPAWEWDTAAKQHLRPIPLLCPLLTNRASPPMHACMLACAAGGISHSLFPPARQAVPFSVSAHTSLLTAGGGSAGHWGCCAVRRVQRNTGGVNLGFSY